MPGRIHQCREAPYTLGPGTTAGADEDKQFPSALRRTVKSGLLWVNELLVSD